MWIQKKAFASRVPTGDYNHLQCPEEKTSHLFQSEENQFRGKETEN